MRAFAGKSPEFQNAATKFVWPAVFAIALLFSSPTAEASETTPVPAMRPAQTAAAVQQQPDAPASMAQPAMRPADPPPPTRIVGSEDYYALKTFIALIEEESLIAALAIQETIIDPLARDLAEWFYVRNAAIHAAPERIGDFIAAHPVWPDIEQIRVRQEGAYFLRDITPEDYPRTLAPHQPISNLGKVVLARWNVANGNRGRAAELIREVWHLGLLSRSREDQILEEFSDFLDAKDHIIRARRLHYRGRNSGATRIARIANTATPENSDPLNILRQAQAQRRRGNPVTAANILLDATPENQHLADARGWWPERRLLVRRLLLESRPGLAYRLAAGHNNPPGLYLAEGEFLAGWIALRHQLNPDIALEHFTRLREAVTSPLSVSRAEYWLGRTEQTRDNQAAAANHFTNAARYQYTYYGQLAALETDQPDINISPAPNPAPADRELFEAGELARAALLLSDLGAYRSMQKFLIQIGRISRFDPEIAQAALYAENRGRADIALRIGKAAIRRNRPQLHAAFTLAGLPEGFGENRTMEPALTYAIARQESAFLQTAVSHSGARGLLQLMPATAREVATGLQLPYNLARLTQDPSYNVNLGATYLEGLLERFSGSYIMSIAGYNAGGGRVTQWMESFGDPRNGIIDPIDWIEMIPFNETRNYVQRVLANLQIYRARLNNDSHPLELREDLARGGN